MIECSSFFLVSSQSSSTPLYPQSATSQGACPYSLPFHYFHFKLSIEFIKEPGSMSASYLLTKTILHEIEMGE
jgi:hypothetical protein